MSDCAAPVYSCGASDGAPSPNWSAPVYQRLMQHLTVSTNTTNGGDDILQVNFINTGPQLMTSYGGGSIPIDANKPPDPTRVNNYIFQVNNRNLQLIEQISNSPRNTYTIAQNIERMYVLVGESDRVLTQIVTGAQSTQLPEMNRYVRFSSSNRYTTSYASGTANLYPYRVNAVRIALVASSQDGLTPTAAATSMNVMRANDGTFITYTPASADRRLRKVFITTIYLNSYGLPEYRMHCALNSSGTNYQLKTGGIPFVQMTTNDLCCANNNYTSSPGSCTTQSFALCEQQRMTGGC